LEPDLLGDLGFGAATHDANCEVVVEARALTG